MKIEKLFELIFANGNCQVWRKLTIKFLTDGKLKNKPIILQVHDESIFQFKFKYAIKIDCNSL